VTQGIAKLPRLSIIKLSPTHDFAFLVTRHSVFKLTRILGLNTVVNILKPKARGYRRASALFNNVKSRVERSSPNVGFKYA
jgi:hypothetical protein